MPTRVLTLAATVALCLGAGCASPAHATVPPTPTSKPAPKADSPRATLTAELGNPVVLAGDAQKAYLKIGVTGFEMPDRTDRAPVNIALVLDKSSSMAGEKLAEAKRAAIMAVHSLGPNDTVSVIAYDSTVTVVVPSTRMTDPGPITAQIEQLQAGGSTALFAGVSRGAAQLRLDHDRERVSRVILLSDGQANVGPSSPGELAQLGASLSREGISVTTIGLGLGYNEDLMVALARAGDGNHAFAQHAADLAQIFKSEFGDVTSVVAQDVRIDVRCGTGIRPLRVLGRDALIEVPRVASSFNQVYARQEKYILLEVELPRLGPDQKRRVADVTVAYTNMATGQEDELSQRVSVETTGSQRKVTAAENEPVMISVTEMLATEQNRIALALRDEGKLVEAKTILESNAAFVEKQNRKLRSPRLKKLEDVSRDSASNLEERDWRRTRKQMVDDIFEFESQQTY